MLNHYFQRFNNNEHNRCIPWLDKYHITKLYAILLSVFLFKFNTTKICKTNDVVHYSMLLILQPLQLNRYMITWLSIFWIIVVLVIHRFRLKEHIIYTRIYKINSINKKHLYIKKWHCFTVQKTLQTAGIAWPIWFKNYVNFVRIICYTEYFNGMIL